MESSEYLGALLPGVLGQLRRQARQRKYFSDPVAWGEDFLGVRLWSKQQEVARSVVTDKNVIVKAGHEVGKSFLAGFLICWWIDTRWNLPGGCFVVSTAPSTKQINAIVWREVRKFHALAVRRNDEYRRRLGNGETLGEYSGADHELPGYITADAHWRLPDGIELGYGAKPPEGKEDTMSGIHARYVLAVGDEAVGLSSSLIGDLGNITSNATSRRFLICNPTNPLSYVATIFKKNTGVWATHTISVFDSPNFHGGEDFPVEVLETLVDQSYVDDMRRDHGVLSPTYISRVTGEFAWDMGPTLISLEDMAVALDCEIEPDGESLGVLGVDFSRSDNGDKNTVYHNNQGKLRLVDSWSEKDAMKTAVRVHEITLGMGIKEIRVDGSGLGGPIADRLRELSGGRYLVVEMIGGAASPNNQRWANARAFWYWHLQNEMVKGRLDIDIGDEQLQQELLGIETKYHSVGVQKMYIESKKEMRKRGVGSPDYADGAMYATADISAVVQNPLNGMRPGTQLRMNPWEQLQLSRVGPGRPI